MDEMLMQYNYFVSREEAEKSMDPFVEKLLANQQAQTQAEISNEREVSVA